MTTNLNMSLVLDPMTSDEGVTLGYNVMLDGVRVALWVVDNVGTFLLFNLDNQEFHVGLSAPYLRFQADSDPLYGRITVAEADLPRFTNMLVEQGLLEGAA